MKTFIKNIITFIISMMMILSSTSMRCVSAKQKKNVFRKITLNVKQKKSVTMKNVKKVSVSPKTKAKVSQLKKKGKKVKNRYMIFAKKLGKAKVTFISDKQYIYKITIKTSKKKAKKKKIAASANKKKQNLITSIANNKTDSGAQDTLPIIHKIPYSGDQKNTDQFSRSLAEKRDEQSLVSV